MENLRLILWDDEALVPLAQALEESGALVGVQVERLPREACEGELRAGLADVALVPTVRVLADMKAFDAYPAVAISSWCSPFARIRLPGRLDSMPEALLCGDGHEQETLMARIVLQEHYGMQPQVTQAAAADRASDTANAVVEVEPMHGPPAAESEAGAREAPLLLDLGQEWFEFTNYPMVWALFAARAGEADARIVPLLREAAVELEKDMDAELTIEELVHDSSLRYRLDDVATASLTELADLMFFYRVTPDVPAVQFAADPDDVLEDDLDDPELRI